MALRLLGRKKGTHLISAKKLKNISNVQLGQVPFSSDIQCLQKIGLQFLGLFSISNARKALNDRGST